MEGNFLISGKGVKVAATSSSQRIPATSSAPDIMIYNPGPNVVYIRAGSETVVADDECMPVPAGEKGVYAAGYAATHLALVAPNGNQTVTVLFGQGS
jgi:hypothetical protein